MKVVPLVNSLEQPSEMFLNRELSLLEFNRRVLHQARDEYTPLLERMRFLCISSINLDEFFEVHVAGLIQKVELGSTVAGPDNMPPQEILRAIYPRVNDLVDEQYRVLNDQFFPALREYKIRFLRRDEWNESQKKWLLKYFKESLRPVLCPIGLDHAHPFPRIINKSLNFIASLSGKDAFGRNSGLAVVSAPRSLPMVIQLPPDETDSGPHDYVFLSSVIHAHIDVMFNGMKVLGCYQFRVTRNSELFVDEEEIDDLLRAVEGELPSRHFGDAVRIEVAHNCPDELVDYIVKHFENISNEALYRINGPVDLSRIQDVYDLIDINGLKYPPFTPGFPKKLSGKKSIFDVIAKSDVLLLHPFESYTPVIDFLRQAAKDPNVLAIKQTLYRTEPKSSIADALVKAAHAGKEVTVVIELRARFDEEANVALATRLQRAGAHVVYGVVGYKTHAKLIQVVRREGRRLRNYVHLSTGNYHAKTTRTYTDYGLMTCNRMIGEDIQRVFNQLTSLGKAAKMNKVLHAPFTLHQALLDKIEREIDNANKGSEARITIKVNALIEPELIEALYRASQNGVQIDCIVRGMCRLRPGVTGLSENIRVRSIIGRFLEHFRVFIFHNDDNHELYLSSADWMERNMFRRVEVCFPIEDAQLKARIIKDVFYYLDDNCQAWLLQSDGSYLKVETPADKPFSAQQTILEALAEVS